VSIWLRRFILALLGMALALAALIARVVLEGESEMSLSDAAFHEGDVLTATVHARRAASLYAPAAPHVSRAFDRLTAIATGAEATGQPEVAASAWRAMRAAALETRHAVAPHALELERANGNLARLEARPVEVTLAMDALVGQPPPASASGAPSFFGDAPGPLWSVLLVLGFGACALGVAALALRGLHSDGRLRWAGARYPLLVVGAGAVCWALALVNA
jgi:hypothetical protein